MFDTLFKNARLFDGERFFSGSLAVKAGKIAAIGDPAPENAAQVIDCAGLTLTPGLIDAHLHFAGVSEIDADPALACLPYGVTAAVDAGGAGENTLEACGVLRRRPIGAKYFLNVCSAGFSSLRAYPENVDPARWQEDRIALLFERYPEALCGLKIRMGRECAADTRPVAEAVRLARSLSTRLMVHVSDPAMPAGEIADLLGEGDIFTHTYQGRGNGILLADGTVDPRVREARERGVLFDVGDAHVHFAFSVFRRAAGEGFFPDTAGSDVTDRGLCAPGAFSLPVVLSKLVTLGMDEAAALRAATSRPAEIFGFSGGRLRVGADADLAVFAVLSGVGSFTDSAGERIPANYLLSPRLTMRRGALVWRSVEWMG
ncbi:MAG: amidohydrolase family protein [Clostridia bacterium]|nr:amidohydrolase family protein [Clostridia bacterium]